VKQYEPWRGPHCPTGQHAATDPTDGAGEPISPDEAAKTHRFNEECTCPWLVATSTTPVAHMTSWTRRELDRLIQEADNGYFDPRHYPPRRNQSRFLPPLQQRLLELLDGGDELAAVQTLLGNVSFDRVTWHAETRCLSLRRQSFGAAGVEHEWLQLFLESDAGQYTARADAPGGDVDTIDGLWEERPVELAEAVQTRSLVDGARGQVRSLVRGVIQAGGVRVPVDVTDISEQGGMTVAHGTFPSGEAFVIAQQGDRTAIGIDPALLATGGIVTGPVLVGEGDIAQGWRDEPLPLDELRADDDGS